MVNLLPRSAHPGAGARFGRMFRRTSLALLSTAVLVGCVANPVTGSREFGFMGTGQEIALGREHYGPTQQMEGGVYRLDPELNAYVARVTEGLAAVSDRELPYEIVVLNSSVPNAWALPGGKMAINRGLIVELENEAELAAVIGHEITHAAARHGAQRMERGMLLQGAVVAAAIASSSSEYAPYVMGAAQLGAVLISHRHGRDAEREADYFGMQYMHRAGYDPTAAISLQETFLRLSEGRSTDWLSGLFASHPPSAERVANNRKTAAELGPGGELGRERYQAATAALRGRQEAYDAGDAARLALRERDTKTAIAKLEEAIALEPKEARFHGLLADIHYHEGRHQQALRSYDRAIELDDAFFAHWQGRGLTRMELGQRTEARSDLERGMTLLPTADAANALGQMALAGGRTQEAREYLGAASQAQGPAAVAAQASLARLDMPQHPERFVSVRWGSDDQGRVILEIGNRSPLAVNDVVVEVRLRQADGSTALRRVPIAGTLAAGASTQLRTQISLPAGTPAEAVAAAVVAARPAP